MKMQQTTELRWRRAIETGELGVWDLRPELETVHHSPQWKQRLGFPEPHNADSTHFWRCRVHPDDIEGMLVQMRAQLLGHQPDYEATFRLRSNGSGYRLLLSRGRVIERTPEGRALRMVGTMIDLTARPSTPQVGLAEGPRGSMEGLPMALPFHLLLADEQAGAGWADSLRSELATDRQRVLPLVEDMLRASVEQLEPARAC